MTDFDEHRHRRGGDADNRGRFSAFDHPDVADSIELNGTAVDSALDSQSTAELERFVGDPDPLVRAEVTSHINVSSEQIARLLSPEQPFITRVNAARTLIPGFGHVIASDRDPMIRRLALERGDLDDDDRARLDCDRDVQRLNQMFAAA